MSDEIHHDVDLLNKAVFGDRENPKDAPGLIAEHESLRTALVRTNEILTELRNAVLWINGLLVTGFITALVTLVLKVV